MANSFGSRSTLKVGAREFEIYRLSALEKVGLRPSRLPFSLRILLENLLRTEDGKAVKLGDYFASGRPVIVAFGSCLASSDSILGTSIPKRTLPRDSS